MTLIFSTALFCALIQASTAWVFGICRYERNAAAFNGRNFCDSILVKAKVKHSPVILFAEKFSGAAAFDQFLGELVFSSNDPAYDIANNYERASNIEFRAWLKEKYESSSDLEERVALSSLADIIDAVVMKIDEARKNDVEDAEFTDTTTMGSTPFESSSNAANEIRSNEEVFNEMRAVQGLRSSVQESDISVTESENTNDDSEENNMWESVPDSVRKSYEQVLKMLMIRQPTVTLTEAVEQVYEKCDLQFLALLKEKIKNSSSPEEAKIYIDIDTEVNLAMQRRISQASEKLQKILTAGKPVAIEAKAYEIARNGEADDALVLLLEANLQQAEQAGALGKGAVQLLTKIKKIIQTEVDSKAEPEKRLLRQCLRETDSERIEYILKEAFRPRVKLALPGGGESSEDPIVTPPTFIGAMKNLLLNFGNIGKNERDFAEKIEIIIQCAEKVATELYGESMSAKEQQDRAWKEHGASVWDLEKLENDAEMRGEEMPWANDKYDHILPNLKKGGKQGEFDIGGN